MEKTGEHGTITVADGNNLIINNFWQYKMEISKNYNMINYNWINERKKYNSLQRRVVILQSLQRNKDDRIIIGKGKWIMIEIHS